MKNINIYAFADEASPNINGQITVLKENRLDGLEIRNVDNVSVSEISNAKAKEVRKKLDDAGLTVWSIGSPIGKIDIERDSFAVHTEKFRRTLEIAEILGAENIRLFSFFVPKDKNPADYKEEVINRLGTFLDLAKGTGVTLCHENEKGIYGDIPERCLEIHKALPEMPAIFDPANYIQCGADTLEGWKMLSGYVKYLHIKDALKDGSVVPAGKGDGNIPIILGEFRNKGGNCVTLEPHLAVFEGLSSLEQEGDTSAVGEVYRYPSNTAAFKAAADELKKLIYGGNINGNRSTVFYTA